MGARRKDNPRYHLGLDSLGRKSWQVHPSAAAASAAALRAGFAPDHDPSELDSKLNPQLGPTGVMRLQREAEQAAYEAVDRKGERSPGFDFAKTMVAGGGGMALSAAVFSVAPLAVIPIMLASIATVFGSDVRKVWRRRKVRRGYRSQNVSKLDDHRREARELVRLMPHRDGNVETTPWTGGDDSWNSKSGWVRCSVEATGVAEVEWGRFTGDGQKVSGTLVFHPGANLRSADFPHAVRVPYVNLRNANLRDWRVPRGSTMDGGDFRGVKASNSEWDGVSLRGATFAGAQLRYAELASCDMDGVDLADADVTGARLPLDLTGTNISREQLDSLAFMGPDEYGVHYKVREVSFDEVLSAMGGDRETLTVAMWAGDIEVRSRDSNKVVAGKYDPDEHYIPHWSLEAAKQYTR